MSNPTQKTSEELAIEMEKQMPKIKSARRGWGAIKTGNAYGGYATEKLYELAELVLAQQQDIEQLKTELEELKRKG